MKRKKLLFLIPFIFAFVLAFIPVAHAEENGETTVEVFEKKSYTLKDTDDNTILVTLVSETEVEFYNTKTEETTKGVYTLNGNVLTIVKEDKSLSFTINEDNTLTEKVAETPKSTFSERAYDFLDRWLTVIVSAVSGVTGSLITVFLCKTLVKSLTKQLENGINLNADERKKVTEDLQKTKDTLNEYQVELKTEIENIKDTLPQLKEDFGNLINSMKEENQDIIGLIKSQSQDYEKLKELVILLVASTPALANNGFSTKILNMLGVGKPVEDSKAGDGNEQKEV